MDKCYCINCKKFTTCGAFCKKCGSPLDITVEQLDLLIGVRLATDGFKSVTRLPEDVEILPSEGENQMVPPHGANEREFFFGLGPRQIESEQVKERVLQHRGVTVRQDEAIAQRPRRIRGIEAQVLVPEFEGRAGETHRRAGVTAAGLLDRVDGEEANGGFDALAQREIELLRHPDSDGWGWGAARLAESTTDVPAAEAHTGTLRPEARRCGENTSQ